MLQHLQTFNGHQNPVYALANSDKAGIFFSAGNDKGVVEWSLKKMAFVMVKMPVQSSVYAMHNYNNRLYVGERSGAINVYDFIDQKIITRFPAHLKSIFDIRTVKTKNELITSSEDGTVAIWSLSDFKSIYKFQVAYETVRCMAISPDETEIAFGCKDHCIRIYNLDDYSLKQTIDAHKFAVTALNYHPEGKYLISGSRDAQLKVWNNSPMKNNSSNYELHQTIPAHLYSIYGIVFHPILPYFATCSQDKSIKIWDAENFKLYKILSLEKSGNGHNHSINKIIWSNDGEHLISTGDDRQVMVWKMED